MTSGGTKRRRNLALYVAALVIVVLFVLVAVKGPLSTRGLRAHRTRVGVLAEHAHRQLAPSSARLSQELLRRYELSEVRLGVPGALDSLDVLIVLGSGHLPDARLYEIDQFLMRGGRVAFLLDGMGVSAERMSATVVRGNIFSYVEAYGPTVNPDLVVDTSGGSLSYPDADGSRPYAFWPVGIACPQSRGGVRVPTSGDLVFAWTSSVSLSEKLSDGATASVIARSSDSSWTVIAHADLDPSASPERVPGSTFDTADAADGLPLAVAIDGVFVSAFEDLPIIVESEDGTVEFTYPPGRIEQSEPTRIFVTGSSTMFDDFVVEHAPENLELLLAAVDWLAR